TIGIRVASIGDYAFYERYRLKDLYFKGNAPELGGYWVFGYPTPTAYYLPGTAGWGATLGDLRTAPWPLPAPLIFSNAPRFGMQTNRFGFTISWATNVPVVVEASTSLSHPVWLPVSTNSLNSGSAYYSDPDWKSHPTRFYRVRSR
ncbi:MAG: hypothetical protein WCR20_22675, partial [Verrucomicrobiota bacterium]